MQKYSGFGNTMCADPYFRHKDSAESCNLLLAGLHSAQKCITYYQELDI